MDPIIPVNLSTRKNSMLKFSHHIFVPTDAGDHYLRPYVISEPEVTVTERTESDDFIVIASDGLWDVISNELACEVGWIICLDNGRVKRTFPYDLNGKCAGDAAAVLAELAMARGSQDNISVIVVQLRKSS